MADLKKMQGFAGLAVSLSRGKYGPLDVSNVFYSIDTLKWYLKFSSTDPKGTRAGTRPEEVSADFIPYPYEGQIIAVEEEGRIKVYVLGPELSVAKADGTYFNYEEVGSKTVGDGNSIDLIDGELSIHGFEDATNKQVPYKDIDTGKIIWGDISGLIPGAVIPVTDGETINVTQDLVDNTKYLISIKGKEGAVSEAVLRKHIINGEVSYTWDEIYDKSQIDNLLLNKQDNISVGNCLSFENNKIDLDILEIDGNTVWED